MEIIITQNYTPEHIDLFNLTSPLNIKYANNNGYKYISSNIKRAPNRNSYWEKIAWLNELLPTLPDNTIVLYEDCDSINLSGDISKALPDEYQFGAVHLRGGLESKKVKNWFNSGVMIMKNTPTVRLFLNRVWNRNDKLDEISLNDELRSKNNTIGEGKFTHSLDVEWNSWGNNEKLSSRNIYIKSWHGVKYQDKISAIKEFITTNKLN